MKAQTLAPATPGARGFRRWLMACFSLCLLWAGLPHAHAEALTSVERSTLPALPGQPLRRGNELCAGPVQALGSLVEPAALDAGQALGRVIDGAQQLGARRTG